MTASLKRRIVSFLLAVNLASAFGLGLIPYVVPASRAEDQPPFPIGSKTSRAIQKYTGVNWLTSAVAGQIAGAVLSHKLKGKARVKVRTYSLTDFVAGKVKSVDVRLKESQVEGLDLPELRVASKNPIWYSPFKGKQNKRGLHNPVVLSVEGKLNEEDVEEALRKQEVATALSVLKLDIPGLNGQELEVLDPSVEIKKGLVEIKGTLVTRGAKPDTGVPITISANPTLVASNEIRLENLKVESPYIVDPDQFAKFISDLLNPIVRFSRYDRNTHAFRLMALDVSDETVYGAGNLLLVPKDYKPVSASSQAVQK